MPRMLLSNSSEKNSPTYDLLKPNRGLGFRVWGLGIRFRVEGSDLNPIALNPKP